MFEPHVVTGSLACVFWEFRIPNINGRLGIKAHEMLHAAQQMSASSIRKLLPVEWMSSEAQLP